MTADLAMQIPAVARCIDMISGAVSALPVKLYKPVADGMREIKDDVRVMLLNSKTGDSLNADEMRRMWVKDYILAGSAYAVIDKNLYGEFKRILYVSPKSVAVSCNRVDPANKLFEYRISGRKYYPYQLLKILRHSDGYGKGKGIVCENSLALSVGYNMLRFEKTLISSGGNKRGFLKAEKHLNEEAMNKLKEAWKKLYSNSGDGCIILNDGMDFKEASSTNMEMQLSQNITLSNNSIYNIFGTKDGSLNEETVRNSIMPVLDSFEAAFDADLLTEKEKEAGYYFAFDTRELTRGDITKRYSAYATALDKGFMQIDEVRKEEDLPPLGIKFVKLNLADSFYDPETQMIYTPNTNQWAKFGESVENNLTGRENNDIIEERGNKNHDPKNGRFTFGKNEKEQFGLKSELKAKIESGEISTKLDKKKQGRHVIGNPDYEKRIANGETPSCITVSKMKIQEIINSKSLTGKLEKEPDGQYKELITADENFGIFVSLVTHKQYTTNRGVIHYSKTGTHLVPTASEETDDK